MFPDCARPNTEQFCGRPASEEEKAYVENNTHHGNYHFTDVPIAQPKYVAFSAGTDEYDVVQMINYVVEQLRGKTPKDKPKWRDVSSPTPKRSGFSRIWSAIFTSRSM